MILRFALRELRGGFAGFRIFFLCLMLGAAAIAGVQAVSSAFLNGLRDQGQTLLGGDVAVSLVHRPAAPAERAFLNRHGTVSAGASMRAMAYAANGNRQLIELKAVDGRWPLFGAPGLAPDQPLHDVIACEDDGVCGAADGDVGGAGGTPASACPALQRIPDGAAFDPGVPGVPGGFAGDGAHRGVVVV